MVGEVGRQAKRQTMALWILVGAGLFGAAIGAGGALLKELEIAPSRGLMFAGGLVGFAALFVGSVVYWRNIDEAAREAHKFAWFWGGSMGLLAMLPISILISSERLVAVLGQRSPGEWVAFGMMSLLSAQLIGYGLVWAAWWLRQR